MCILMLKSSSSVLIILLLISVLISILQFVCVGDLISMCFELYCVCCYDFFFCKHNVVGALNLCGLVIS